jgi:membrane protease YdiL (CAAX protease family)
MADTPALQRENQELTAQQRLISSLEVCLAVFIVVAHNVYHWVPNEVPILFVLAIISFRIREGSWGIFLYKRPKSWLLTVVAALLCVGLFELKDLVLDPIGHHFWPAPEKVSSVITGNHDWRQALVMVPVVWIFAAFGEEIGYRGYILRRTLEAFGPSRWGAVAGSRAAFSL